MEHTEPAYTRLGNDERRAQLLALGAELFTRHAYDELSMAAIAKEAGISKALLYHYFPSKQAFFLETLDEKGRELSALVRPDPDLPGAEQLTRALDAFLGWVEGNAEAYGKLLRSSGVPEVRELVERVRADTAQRILAGVMGEDDAPPPALRAAVNGWLWYLDGVLVDWLEHRDLDRPRLRALLLGTLLGAVTAAGGAEREREPGAPEPETEPEPEPLAS